MPDINYTEPENLVRDFVSRGMVVLSPEQLGVAPELHARIYEQEKDLFNAGARVSTSSIPEVLEVLRADGLVKACNQLVGENWAIVPFAHNAPFPSGSRDQHWHKDDNAPYNSRKHRHHHAVQIEIAYYPQAVAEDMGPTATIPWSHYWTFNHEENHDNFAGADHLDFNYQLTGMERTPISGPDSAYTDADVAKRNTEHDFRMRDAVTNTGWPLVKTYEAAPVRAGSIMLMSHNLFHRGNHRRDDWRIWQDQPRFMWRFWLYRTTEPENTRAKEIDWNGLGEDPLTGVDVGSAPSDITAVWRHHYCWLQTGQMSEPQSETAMRDTDEQAAIANELATQLHLPGDSAEPQRIGAAYKLAAFADTALSRRHLGEALHDDRESVRRAATYGLVAMGERATDIFRAAAVSPIKWVRKAGIFGLGEVAALTPATLACLQTCLWSDRSVYVRSVAAGSLGCLGRRAVAKGEGLSLISDCVQALIESLSHEENRLGMDKAQGRSIKFVRPTDESDVCEGIGVDFGLDRYDPVRSAVRENALWSLVILCTHAACIGPALGPTITALKKIVREDRNPISVGYAMDALSRLVNLPPIEPAEGNADQLTEMVSDLAAELPQLLQTLPVRSWESLICSGIDVEAAIRLERELDQ